MVHTKKKNHTSLSDTATAEYLLSAAASLPYQTPSEPTSAIKNMIQRLTRLHEKIFGWHCVQVDAGLSTSDYLALLPKDGADIYSVGQAAVMIARLSKMPVVLQYENVPVYATPNTKSRNDFYQLWQTQAQINLNRKKEEPDYAQTLANKTLRHQNARKIIRGERFNVISESAWQTVRLHAPKEVLALMDYAERLACYLQVKLRQNNYCLTPALVSEAEKSVAFHNESPEQKLVAYDLLCNHWVYGEKLAHLNPEKTISGKTAAFLWMKKQRFHTRD